MSTLKSCMGKMRHSTSNIHRLRAPPPKETRVSYGSRHTHSRSVTVPLVVSFSSVFLLFGFSETGISQTQVIRSGERWTGQRPVPALFAPSSASGARPALFYFCSPGFSRVVNRGCPRVVGARDVGVVRALGPRINLNAPSLNLVCSDYF